MGDDWRNTFKSENRLWKEGMTYKDLEKLNVKSTLVTTIVFGVIYIGCLLLG